MIRPPPRSPLFPYPPLSRSLTAGIVQAQKGMSSYYLIGYYTSNDKLDGKFRRIKISLNNGVSANLDYRQGYFSDTPLLSEIDRKSTRLNSSHQIISYAVFCL